MLRDILLIGTGIIFGLIAQAIGVLIRRMDKRSSQRTTSTTGPE